LRERLSRGPLLLAPGVYDALTALIAEKAGFEALYLSGASVAYTRLGRPDIGLVGMTEVAETLANICGRVRIPVIVDADTGFGNALNVVRTVQGYERAGVAGVHLEDQVIPKRCGHLAGKQVVPVDEAVAKIRAAADARTDKDFVIIARTDAIAVEGLESAMARAARYAEAGADVLFIEAPQSVEDMKRIAGAFPLPLLANMVEGGKTPVLDAASLEKIGYRIAIFPGGLARRLAHAAGDYFAVLKKDGTTAAMAERMLDFKGLNELIGTPSMLELGRKYDK
jgi:2-methylisocitrate lyase-like PEP mutase family enzyme